MIDIQNPEGFVQLAFDAAAPPNTALSVDSLQAVTVPAGMVRTPVVGLAESMQGPFGVSDDRFEVVGDLLRLRAGQSLALADSGLQVMVSEVDRPAVKQTFLLNVVDLAEINPWHNAVTPSDVDGDGLTTPRDPLLVLDALSNGTDPSLPLPPPEPHDFLDVNGDASLSPLDVLAIIDELTGSDGEGEEDDGA